MRLTLVIVVAMSFVAPVAGADGALDEGIACAQDPGWPACSAATRDPFAPVRDPTLRRYVDACVAFQILKPACDSLDRQDGENNPLGSASQGVQYRLPRARPTMLLDQAERFAKTGELGYPGAGDLRARPAGLEQFTPLGELLLGPAFPDGVALREAAAAWRAYAYAHCLLDDWYGAEPECDGEIVPGAPASPLLPPGEA